MGSYNKFKDGYAFETIFKTSTIDEVGDTAYKLGVVSELSEHPSPTFSINYAGTGVNTYEVGVGNLWKSQAQLRGFYGLRMQNGILCKLAMGYSSTEGEGPYTHTIGPTTDGSLLPSITINHEAEGSATDEEYQWTGCKVDSLMLYHDLRPQSNFLMAKVEMMAAKAQDGIALTTPPALPATANEAQYPAPTRTWDSNDTPVALTGLQTLEIHIVNGLTPVYAHSYDSGVYTGQWVDQFIEAPRKQYRIVMELHPSTIERALWDELIATGNTKDAQFKWTRSTNDYIQVDASDCQVIEHTIRTPPVGETLIERVMLEPRALAIQVKDSIAGGLYGE